ncbi:60S ribosomal protein L24-2 [Picochlorum sp. SENEW3]|nr:60S ribosomal protein L24-2 [Picochlorum sp. SENEW3]
MLQAIVKLDIIRSLTQTCRFSGLKIYPGRGMLYIRVDGQQFLFLKQKCKALFNQRKRPAKLAWTTTYRKQHRKDQEQQVSRRKKRSTARVAVRSVAGASLEVIAKKKAEKPEQRKASREAALREIKERTKKAKAEKSAQKAAARAQGQAARVPKAGKR